MAFVNIVENTSRKIGRVSDILERFSGYLCILLMSFMAVVIFCNVIGRYFLFQSISWAEESARFAMSWVTLLASGIALKKWLHPGIDTALKMFSEKASKRINIGTKFLILFFLIVLLKEGYSGAMFAGEYQVSPALKISMLWPILSVPVGALLMIIHLIYLILLDIQEKRLSSDDFYV